MYKIIRITREALLVMGAVVAMVFATGSANAGEGYRGFSIGIILNDSTVNTSGTEFEKGTHEVGYPGGATLDENITSISKDVDFPSVFMEYSYGNIAAVTIGIEYIPGAHSIGTKSRTDTAVAAAIGGAENDTGTRTGKAEIRNLVTLYIEPGIMFNDYIGIYAKAGAMGMKVEALESNLPNSSYGTKEVWGAMYGAGIKAVSPWGIFLKLEGTKVDFATVEFESTTGNKNIISAQPDMDSVKLAIGYNF